MEPLHIPWLTVGFLLVLNFCISWWNAYAVGVSWVETKQIGGWPRFMNWMGAIMSASGFSWCYLVMLTCGFYYAQPYFIGDHKPYLNVKAVVAAFNIGYLVLIPGILFAGLMIWLDSLIQAWQRRDLSSFGVAAWNTYAQVHNTYSAYSGIGGAFDSVGDFLKGGDDDDDGKSVAVILVLVIVAMAIAGGVLTTWAIVSHFAGTRPIVERQCSKVRN